MKPHWVHKPRWVVEARGIFGGGKLVAKPSPDGQYDWGWKPIPIIGRTNFTLGNAMRIATKYLLKHYLSQVRLRDLRTEDTIRVDVLHAREVQELLLKRVHTAALG